MKIRLILLSILVIFNFQYTFAAYIYVAPWGNDSVNNGSIVSPYFSIMRAQADALPGDTVYLRGGVYHLSEKNISAKEDLYACITVISKSGKSENKKISYIAFPGEKPIFDASQVKPENYRITVFKVKASWVHFKGFEVTGTQVTIKKHAQSECFRNEGSNNLYEQLAMHDGQAIGFYLTRGSNNLILNCDAYRNWDYTSQGGKGGNVDGFGAHPRIGDKGNTFRGCRAWFNSDDGFDLIRAYESVLIDSCWAFYNGYSYNFVSLGDGNGFKIGGWGNNPANKIPEIVPRHTVQFCLAVGNKANGFYANHQIGGGNWYNNTSYRNGTNYNMLNRTADNQTDVPGYDHILKNNLSFAARTYDTQHIDSSRCDISFNSFSTKVKVRKKDFESTAENLLISERKENGNLPETNFLKLKPKSKHIDKGKYIGFSYRGKAPDLGAWERK